MISMTLESRVDIYTSADEYSIECLYSDGNVDISVYEEETLLGSGFETIDHAFGWLNNKVLDEHKIGEDVNITLNTSRGSEKLSGVIEVNHNYNDEYPYRVNTGEGICICSKEEICQ